MNQHHLCVFSPPTLLCFRLESWDGFGPGFVGAWGPTSQQYEWLFLQCFPICVFYMRCLSSIEYLHSIKQYVGGVHAVWCEKFKAGWPLCWRNSQPFQAVGHHCFDIYGNSAHYRPIPGPASQLTGDSSCHAGFQRSHISCELHAGALHNRRGWSWFWGSLAYSVTIAVPGKVLYLHPRNTANAGKNSCELVWNV